MYNDREERDYGVTAGHVVAGVVFGAAVGAALGLMLAPRTGKETRRVLAESSERVRRQASDAYRAGVDQRERHDEPRPRRRGAWTRSVRFGARARRGRSAAPRRVRGERNPVGLFVSAL